MHFQSDIANEKNFSRSLYSDAILFGVAYVACATGGRFFSSAYLPFVNFWLPSGLFVGILLRYKAMQWPVLAASAFLANLCFDLWNGKTLGIALFFASGNCAEALVGAFLMRWLFAERITLSTLRELGGLFIFCAVLGSMVSAIIGTATIMSQAGHNDWTTVISYWWSGDMLGILLVAPLILSWPKGFRLRLQRRPSAQQIEMAVLFALTCATTILCFDSSYQPKLGLVYLVIPCVLWAALRFGMRTTAVANLIVATIAGWFTSGGLGNMASSDLSSHGQTAVLQLFLIIVTLTGLSLSAVMTERKRAMQALRESEAKYATVFREAPVWIAITDMNDASCIELNDLVLKESGFSRNEVIGHTAAGIGWITAADRTRLVNAIKDHGQISNMEMTFRAKNGRGMHGLVSGEQIVIDDRSCLLTATVNITARKEAEAALAESQSMLQSIINSTADMIWSVNVHDFGLQTFNQPLRDYFERHRGLRIQNGDRPEDLFPSEEYVARWKSFYRRALDSGVFSTEYLVFAGQATLLLTFNVLKNNGHPFGISVFGKDITERKQTELALRKSEAQLKNAQRIAKLGNWENDLTTNTVIWSDEVYRIFEVERANFQKTYEAFLATIHPDDRDLVNNAFKHSLQTRKPYDITHRLLMPDGRIKCVQEVCEICFNSEDKPVRAVGTVQDITEQKRLEEQLRQAQKMEAIGQLAGGVAHDFNNILAAMLLQIDFLSTNPKVDLALLEGLRDLKAQAKRASGLTRQLLAFSRRSVLEIRTLNMNEVVGNLMKMLGRLLGENISLVFETKCAAPMVEADAGMMEQVLMNLAVNARDAMPRGGRITLTTDIVDIDPARAAAHPDRRVGHFVCLSISDNGCGMDALTLSRIFEPFFTTKDVGKGTGLGLATVYGIVAQHKGWPEVESLVGFGTVFRIYLPLVANAQPVKREPESKEIPHGKETILIVEDDTAVRMALDRTLRGLGYQVFLASSGQDAMVVWRDHYQKIDLLLTDMVMPEGMTGLELAEKIRAKKPTLKIIISSGYNSELAQSDRPSQDGIVYLAKPYQVSELGSLLRACLD